MKLIILIPALALLAVGCAPKPAPVNAAQASAPQAAATNGAAECAAASLEPGSQACRDYVAALATANADASNASDLRADMNANAAQIRSQMQAQMDEQRAQMQQDTQNAQKPGSGCTTTRDANNNVSTSCP